MLKEPSSARSKNLEGFDTVHFTPVWTGNPYNPMNLWIAGVIGNAPESGDEIGISDGDKCVGAAVVSGEISEQNPLQIIASQDDNDGKGFVEGHEITIRFWDSSAQKEISVTPSFTDTDGNPITTPTFTGKADYGVTLTLSGAAEFTLNDAITALKILAGINANPADTNADADGNKKVELADVVFILQVVSGIR